MRRPYVLLTAAAAALPLIVTTPASPAVASEFSAQKHPTPEACPPPTVETQYDTERFTLYASLATTGCSVRERRQFSFSAFISRVDAESGHGHGTVTVCGPFRSSDELDGDRSYSCDLETGVDHPPVEAARYDVEVTYPGPDGEATSTLALFCVSSGVTAECEEETRP